MPPKANKYEGVSGLEHQHPPFETRAFNFIYKAFFIVLKFALLHKLVFKSFDKIFGANSDAALTRQGDMFAGQI